MRKLAFILILALLIGFIPAKKAYSYWIWTPKTGRWINPKYAPKPTPKEQMEYALSFYNENNFKEAEREFKSLIKFYPKAVEAAEAQYYLGLIYENQDKLYQAYQAYQKVIDKYPFSERIQEILDREFKIAEKFMEGEKRKFAGVPLPVENPSIEILQKIIDNSQYGPLAPVAQYKLGLVLMGLGRFFEAEEAFEKVVANYPTSEWADAAKFQIASAQAAQAKGAEYDQVTMQEAKGKFEEFVKEHPEAALSKEAEKNISELKQKEAEGNFKIAVFYEKQNAYKAAKTYYETVAQDYPDSVWAKDAAQKALEMEDLALGKRKIDKKALKAVIRQEKKAAKELKAAERQARIQAKKEAKEQKIKEKKEAKVKAMADKQAKIPGKEERLEEKKTAKDEKRAAKIARREERLKAKQEAKEKAKQAKQEKTRQKAEKKSGIKATAEAASAVKNDKLARRQARLEEKKKLKEQKIAEKKARIEEKKIEASKKKELKQAQKKDALAQRQAKIAAKKAAEEKKRQELKKAKEEKKRLAEEKRNKKQEAGSNIDTQAQ